MLELQHENPHEIYVRFNDNILRFSIFEFAIIIDLKCSSNILDFEYPNSTPSVLMKKYFYEKNIVSNLDLV